LEAVLTEIEKVSRCPATLEASQELFKRLMSETTGEENVWRETSRSSLRNGLLRDYTG
jgi:hypothetical protein